MSPTPRPPRTSHRLGFTMLEVMLTMAIVAIMGIAAFMNLQSAKNSTDVTATMAQIQVLLAQAQSDSISQEQNAAWGIYFSNVTSTAPFYALFANSYSPANVKATYRLPATVGYAPSFLASGATTSITFAQISGVPSTATTISVYLIANPTIAASSSVGF